MLDGVWVTHTAAIHTHSWGNIKDFFFVCVYVCVCVRGRFKLCCSGACLQEYRYGLVPVVMLFNLFCSSRWGLCAELLGSFLKRYINCTIAEFSCNARKRIWSLMISRFLSFFPGMMMLNLSLDLGAQVVKMNKTMLFIINGQEFNLLSFENKPEP